MLQVIDFNSVITIEDSPAKLQDCSTSQDKDTPPTPPRVVDIDERPPEAKRRKLKVMGVKLNFEQVGIYSLLIIIVSCSLSFICLLFD